MLTRTSRNPRQVSARYRVSSELPVLVEYLFNLFSILAEAFLISLDSLVSGYRCTGVWSLLVVLTLLTGFSVPCLAQYDTASVLGTVADSSGAVVSGATVQLRSADTNVTSSTVSEDDGSFSFVSVKIGNYTVTAKAPGFKTTETAPFTVTVNTRQRVKLTLPVGDAAEKITVQDAASLVESDSSERGQVIERDAIESLPLNGRDYTDLALLVPGVRRSENQRIEHIEGAVNINGLPSFFNNFVLDGVDNNAYGTSKQGLSAQVIVPSPDALQEFRVQPDNYSAEFGHSVGGTINAAIRSGTSHVHGSLWEYNRNTALNAVGYFKPKNGKPSLVQNQFGATLGGPLWKNKLFLFGDYEGFRRSEGVVNYTTIADQNQRLGSFTDAKGNPLPIKNPYTGVTYSNGVIPTSAMSPFALKVLSLLPAPNNSGPSNYVGIAKTPTQDDKGDLRADYYVNSKLSLFGRYSHRLLTKTDGTTLTGADAVQNVWRIMNHQLAFGATWIVSPTSLLDFRFGTSLTEGGRVPAALGQPGMAELYGITGLPTAASLNGGLNTQSISGYSGMGRDGSSPQHQDPFVINPKVDYSWRLDRHSIKVGYEFQAVDTVIDDFSNKYGLDSYSGYFSMPKGAKKDSVYNLADFLFGARSSYSLGTPAIANYRQRMHFAYIQDDFRVLSNLTLNLGLRYEFATPQYERDNKLSNFDPVTQTIINAKGGSLYDRALINPDYKNFEPRIGVAYAVNSKTAIRTGYGISHIHFNRAGGDDILGENPPFYAQNTYAQLPSQGICASSSSPAVGCFRPTDLGYPVEFSNPANYNTLVSRITYIPKDIKTTYVQSWQFSVQRELARDLLLDVGYVGNHGVGLWIMGDYNQANPNASGQNIPLQNRRPIQNYGTIQNIFSGGGSTYHALQVKLEKRYRRGLYFINSFTWSKALDEGAGHAEVSNGDDKGVNMRDLRGAKGISAYDQPFANTTTLIWDVPVPKMNGDSAFTRIVNGGARGWQLTLINSILGGQPVNLSYSPSSAFQVTTLSGFVYRPNLTGDPMLPAGQRNANQYFNTANIQIPTDASQPFGNAGRNIARSDRFYQLDLGLHKAFPLFSEQRQLEFRAEAFNVLNKTNYCAPNANVSSSAFGTITQTYPARQLQLALRFVY